MSINTEPLEKMKQLLINSLGRFPFRRASIFTYSPLTREVRGVLAALPCGVFSMEDICEDVRSVPLIEIAINQRRTQYAVVSRSTLIFPEKYVKKFSLSSLLVIPLFDHHAVTGCVLIDRFDRKQALNNELIHEMEQYFNLSIKNLLPRPEPDSKLSKREKEILYWFARGLCMKEVAERIQISEYTVRDYAKSCMRKLGAKNRTEAVAIALRQHVID